MLEQLINLAVKSYLWGFKVKYITHLVILLNNLTVLINKHINGQLKTLIIKCSILINLTV
jgi:hypothetical protein